ncbi:LacI family DNA-binding transcriptional regulator [uncultured Sphingobacterium sp.]|uniref:LacI family DNA-binding transcriptional regulator n=1 Tax=uncultured Sphingobacterium sp. TaxID=182688 RepID=UPI0025D3EDC6|nr:LacI family DNA-binding transcriptional regulator [uncultured Sphingobacterium sp.]
MKSDQITIVDIANELNISKSTVSRALTGHANVKAETRQKILELAEKLDYQRNMQSLSLITNKTNTIGIVLPEFSTSFFPQVVVGAQEEASKHGYSVLISQCNESYATEVANAKVMLANRVDGVMVSLTKETLNYDHWKVFIRKKIPIVFFNRVCNEIMVPKVVVNDYDAAFHAVEHLISLGRRRIAHLAGPRQLSISQKRLNGYCDALIKHGIPIDQDLIIDSDLSLNKIKIFVKFLVELEDPIDGIFAVNDPTAIEAMQIIKKMNKRIPEDIAVVGFSDNYGSSFAEPSLTTVAQPVREIGKTAMELLLGLIGKDIEEWKPIIRTMEAKLMVRDSTVRSLG